MTKKLRKRFFCMLLLQANVAAEILRRGDPDCRWGDWLFFRFRQNVELFS